jgi:hypothetical protein
MFCHVSKSGQTLGNISEKHRETSNVSEFARKHFCFSRSKFCFCNNVCTGGQTGKHLRKHRESQMFPQQCFLICTGLNVTDLQTSCNKVVVKPISGCACTACSKLLWQVWNKLLSPCYKIQDGNRCDVSCLNKLFVTSCYKLVIINLLSMCYCTCRQCQMISDLLEQLLVSLLAFINRVTRW